MKQSRFGWVRPSMDFFVGPLMVSAAETGSTKRLIDTLEYIRNINFEDDQKETALHRAAGKGYTDIVQHSSAKKNLRSDAPAACYLPSRPQFKLTSGASS